MFSKYFGNKKWLGVPSTLALSVLLMSQAQAAGFNAGEIDALIKQGKSQQAYEIALKYRNDLEGEPKYDFYYGIAAINSGHVSDGVFALDRVVSGNPADDRARLELARGYYLLEEDVRARQEFETVMSHNPPDKVRSNIKLYLDRIRIREETYRNTAKAYMEFAMGYDSNINSAPADATFSSPVFGTLSLNDASLEKGEKFAELLLGGQVTQPLGEGNNLTFGFNAATRRHADTDQFETKQLTGFVSATVRDEEDVWKITGQLQEFDVNNIDNRILFGLSGEWSRPLNKTDKLSVAGQVAQIAYPGQSLRDATLYTVASSLARRIDDDTIIYGAGFVGYEDTDTETAAAKAAAERKFIGLRAGGTLRLTNIVSLNGSAMYQYSKYQEENVLLGDTRQDDMFVLSAGAKILMGDKWTMNLNVSYTDNDSTLHINEYERTSYRVGMRYDF